MSRRARVAFAVDVLLIIVFVAIGRRSHDETGNIAVGTLKVAAPFLIALVVGWVVAKAWTDPMSVRSGAIVWVSTVAVGMLLRKFAFGKGTAPAFIIVATFTLCLFLMGWRGIVTAKEKRP